MAITIAESTICAFQIRRTNSRKIFAIYVTIFLKQNGWELFAWECEIPDWIAWTLAVTWLSAEAASIRHAKRRRTKICLLIFGMLLVNKKVAFLMGFATSMLQLLSATCIGIYNHDQTWNFMWECLLEDARESYVITF